MPRFLQNKYHARDLNDPSEETSAVIRDTPVMVQPFHVVATQLQMGGCF